MRTDAFDYDLPPGRIAQAPPAERDQARLLVFNRAHPDLLEHRTFRDLPDCLRPGDLLVLNDTRVLAARLWCLLHKRKVELLLLSENGPNDWWAMMRPGRKIRIGDSLVVLDHAGSPTDCQARLSEKNAEGHGRFRFSGTQDLRIRLENVGCVPLPPYIHRPPSHDLSRDRERYQTIYAREEGSVAAPTAGLHFTPPVLANLELRGISVAYLTLHIGLGTFAPVKAADTEDHVMHAEQMIISRETTEAIRRTRNQGGRVIAVGTSVLRALETAASATGSIEPTAAATKLFIRPPYLFGVVDGLLTNFHLPRSTLLMLVSAFVSPGTTEGISTILKIYRAAIQREYRFFSYGDAMLIL